MIVAADFNLVPRSLNYSLAELLAVFFREKWPVLALSLGIALFPLVLKTPYEHFMHPAGDGTGHWMRGRRLVSGVLLVVAMLAVASIVFLAVFRAEATRAQRQKDDRRWIEAHPGGKIEPAQLTPAENIAFILVSLGLPMAATALFAEGSKKVQTRLALRRELKCLEDLRSKRLEWVRNEALQREKAGKLENELNDAEAWEAKKQIGCHEALAVYISAYEQGRKQRESESAGRSIFELTTAREFRPVRPPSEFVPVKKEEVVQ